MGKHWTKDEEASLLTTITEYQNNLSAGLKEFSKTSGRSYNACYKKYKQLTQTPVINEILPLKESNSSGWKKFIDKFKNLFK